MSGHPRLDGKNVGGGAGRGRGEKRNDGRGGGGGGGKSKGEKGSHCVGRYDSRTTSPTPKHSNITHIKHVLNLYLIVRFSNLLKHV